MKEGLWGCLFICCIIGSLLLFAVPWGFSLSTTAVQATQLYSEAIMWVGIAILIGIGVIVLFLGGILNSLDRLVPPNEE
jgi:hypothetical protein